MCFEHLSIKELQSIGIGGDTAALIELGKRVLSMEFCPNDEHICEHEHELFELKHDLDNEIPPDCPHCGKFISDT